MIVFYLQFIPVMGHTVICYLKIKNWFIFFFFFFSLHNSPRLALGICELLRVALYAILLSNLALLR